MSEVHHTFCRICESLCGLRVTVDGDRITKVEPDDAHVATGGFACVKGIKQQGLYGSPDRLTRPLARRGDRFEPVSWDEANTAIGEKVRQLRRDHGPNSIAMYVGTAAGFSLLHPVFASGFMQGLGSTSLYASATQDCANKFAVARQMYGFPFTQPFPDLDRCRCLIIVGANPVVSKWSFLQVNNPYKTLHAVERDGARIFVVDPRRTETANAAGEHIFIRPDTDVFFYLAFLHEIFARGATRPSEHLTGVAEVEAVVRPWTPERCAEVTKISAETLRRLVDAFLQADGAAIYSSTGVNMGRNGSLAFWLQECIHALTGNLDRAGGTLVGHGIFDFARFGQRFGMLTDSSTSRVGGFTRTNDAFPGGVLADEILTPGKGQVRALFITGGNPLITMPNSARLREAMSKLELVVSLDIYLNESASLAHYVLPATSPFQRPDLPFVFPLFLGLQRKPYLQATRAVLPPEGEQRDEATIYHDLARACGVGLFGRRMFSAALEVWRRWHGWRNPGATGLPNEALLDLVLRLSGQPRFAELLQHPHGLLRAPHTPGTFLGQRVTTDDGKVHLGAAGLLQAAASLEATFQAELGAGDQLRLITKRALTTHNSWTHNLPDFVKGDHDTNHLWVHPDDAARLGLTEGGMADVQSATATVRLPVKLLDTLMPGVVALPHGWGHQHARGLTVASRTRGVNVNLLAADGPGALERTSGMAHLTGIPVDVRPAAGPQDPTSWSGLPAA